MADQPVVHIGENSPEQVAYRLLEDVARVEGKVFWKDPESGETADRRWILDTYAECLSTVHVPSGRRKSAKA